MTTWGESHGKAIGVVIDGCPSGISIDETLINEELAWRAPGKNPYTSPRNEDDSAEIYSGVFDGKTTGAPISIIIRNKDADPSKYTSLKNIYRPGHANYSYLQKYGVFDYRGGGRASARETACRVAAGAIAKAILKRLNISVIAYLKQIAEVNAAIDPALVSTENVRNSSIFCPDGEATKEMVQLIEKTKHEGDSLGGTVEVVVNNLPAGLGDPIYNKLEASLACAMMSIPASKGFEIGTGFQSAEMLGSEHNDAFAIDNEKVHTETNNAGGVIGGITTGMPLIARVAFKPPSSIKLPQNTVSLSGEETQFALPEGSRHDPCVAIRAVPVVEAMASLVIVDAFLSNQSATIDRLI